MIKPIHVYLSLVLAIFAFPLSAQPDTIGINNYSLPSVYQSESIYLQLGTYTKNDQKYDIGIIGGRLRNEMKVSPEAMVVYKKYQKQKVWSLVCAGAQLVTQVAAFTTRDKSRRTALHISGGAISIISIPLYFGSYKNLNKAVWIRNGAVLADE